MRRQLRLFRDLVFVNPFRPERSLLEGEILSACGEEAAPEEVRLDRVLARAEEIETELQSVGSPARLPRDVRDAAAVFSLFRIYHELIPVLDRLAADGGATVSANRSAFRKVEERIEPRKVWIQGAGETAWLRPDHLLACFFQLRRAYDQIHRHIIGRSGPIRELRVRVWESIFTRDMRRYQLWMHQAVGRFPTLVTGPSGSGKELVARSIGLSRFLPFQPETAAFGASGGANLLAVNPAALSPTLVESELFGHSRGAFTGAQADRKGLFETAGESGCVFLDEIGEISGDLQVKLLRLLQSGEFQRLGETRARHFGGKVITATNRDLAAEIERGRFREDLYYRLCGDQVRTPALREILADRPEDLPDFVAFVCRSLFGPEAAVSLGPEIAADLVDALPANYRWPGNFRELEQAVRNIVVTGSYHPSQTDDGSGSSPEAVFASASAPLGDWISLYAKRAVQVHGSRRKAAAALGIDPRTLLKHL